MYQRLSIARPYLGSMASRFIVTSIHYAMVMPILYDSLYESNLNWLPLTLELHTKTKHKANSFQIQVLWAIRIGVESSTQNWTPHSDSETKFYGVSFSGQMPVHKWFVYFRAITWQSQCSSYLTLSQSCFSSSHSLFMYSLAQWDVN